MQRRNSLTAANSPLQGRCHVNAVYWRGGAAFDGRPVCTVAAFYVSVPLISWKCSDIGACYTERSTS